MSLPNTVTRYLNEIDASRPVRRRVEALHAILEDVLPSGVQASHVFLNTFVDSDGATNYENAWFFADDRAFEAENFLKQDEFRLDCTIIGKSIRRWEITAEKFDVNAEASPASRMVLIMQFGIGGGALEGELKASSKNCEFLYAIFKEFVVPNLTGRP
jgi:hypothetical protein